MRRCHFCLPTASRRNASATHARHRWSKFLTSGGGQRGNLLKVGSAEPIWKTYRPGLRNGQQVESSSPHDGFEADRGEAADDCTIVAASSSTCVALAMVENPLHGAPTHGSYKSLGSPRYGGHVWPWLGTHARRLLADRDGDPGGQPPPTAVRIGGGGRWLLLTRKPSPHPE